MDAATDRDRLGQGHRPLVQSLRQRCAAEELHGDEQLAVFLADFVDLADVRMVDARRGPRLAPEALPRGLIVFERGHCLQRDRTMQLFVASRVHDAHAAFAELPFDGVVRETKLHIVPSGAGRGLLGR
ncbi:MAG TPA: hypothetical protein VES67_13945 [Vicinamibacterales bacterium]|nr:hypothetical protein [Vicinamibacterales bacterium]